MRKAEGRAAITAFPNDRPATALVVAFPTVCEAPARLECLAGRHGSRWTCIRDRGSGPRVPRGGGLRPGQERAVGTLLIRARLGPGWRRRIPAASLRVGRLGRAGCWCTSRSWCRSARRDLLPAAGELEEAEAELCARWHGRRVDRNSGLHTGLRRHGRLAWRQGHDLRKAGRRGI